MGVSLRKLLHLFALLFAPLFTGIFLLSFFNFLPIRFNLLPHVVTQSLFLMLLTSALYLLYTIPFLQWCSLVMLSFMVVAATFDQHLWLSELFSHFVPQYALLSLILAFLFARHKKYAAVFVACVILTIQIFRLAPLWQNTDTPPQDYEELRLFTYNISHSHTDLKQVERWIVRHHEEMDILVLIEMSHLWIESLKGLSDYYPYQITHGYDYQYERSLFSNGMAILSKWPLKKTEVLFPTPDRNPVLYIETETPKTHTPVLLYSIHPHSPVSRTQLDTRNALLLNIARDLYKNTRAPLKILAGDFNTTPWSYWFSATREIAGLKNSMNGFGIQNTWPAFFINPFRVPIDHVLVSPQIYVKDRFIGPDLGSDHLPVITRLHLPVSQPTLK